MASDTPQVITDAPGVDAVVDAVREAGRFAIDFEFLWERTYSPQPCLVQVAVGDEVHLVDPIEAHRRTIRWQLEHLARNSAEVDRVLEDPYDYAAEDELVALQRRFMADAAAVRFSSEPGFTSGYYGPVPNPAGARRSMRG